MSSQASTATRTLEAGSDPLDTLGTASPASVHAAAEIIAVTTHDDFLLELGESLGGRAALHPAESIAEALERVGHSRQEQLLVIDTRSVADVRGAIEQAHAQAPKINVVVFATASDEPTIVAATKGSSVFAVLPIPIESRKTTAVFDGALAQAPDESESPHFKAASSSAPEAAEIPHTTTSRAAPKMILGLSLGVAALAVAGAIWWFSVKDKPSLSPAAPQARRSLPSAPAIETQIVKGQVDDLLEKARLAMHQRRYTEPAGDNALLYYRSAAAADGGNAEALDGLSRLSGVLTGRFDEALGQGHYDEAAVALANLKNATPHDARIPALESKLQRAELARHQEEAREKHLADLAAADRAREEQASLRKARERAAAASAAKAAQAEADLAAQARKAQEDANAQQAAQQASASAQSASANAKSAASAPAPKRTRYVAPEYPPAALDAKIGGVVVVEFTVDVKGETREIHVVSADPANTFNQAALAAVKRWRYQPALVDNAPTAVTTRIAIRFAPQ